MGDKFYEIEFSARKVGWNTIYTLDGVDHSQKEFANILGITYGALVTHMIRSEGDNQALVDSVNAIRWKKYNGISAKKTVRRGIDGKFHVVQKWKGKDGQVNTAEPNWGGITGKDRSYRLANIPGPTAIEKELWGWE
ncbi:MAG TPA: hypothetical protein EYP35_05395 [Desulfobacterales bacterium]|nr:hypothetical protein [Desulfobacterales bacterium]